MKRMINLWLLSGAVLWCGYGCSTPPRQVMPGVVPPHTAESAVSAERIKQFRKITGNFKVRGVGLYPEAFRGRYTPAEVAERVRSLGFNRAYCYITTETALDEHLAGVNMVIQVVRGYERLPGGVVAHKVAIRNIVETSVRIIAEKRRVLVIIADRED